MNQKSLDQIHLCVNEMQMVKQLIDSKAADTFCNRLLGIYVMMRVDDVTKIWSHNIPQSAMERHLADGVKAQYNDGLRSVRDKLGAHYQKSDNGDVLFGSFNIFSSVDYANTACMIDIIKDVQSQIEGVELTVKGLCDEDLITATNTLRLLYADDKAYLTNGALDLFGVNKGGVISTTVAQAKGQSLRSIEVMVEMAYALHNNKYVEKEVERMFKRLLVCMVYNYHDNLITRTDIKQNAPQYEEGFDKLFLTLISKNDDRQMLEGAFARFDGRYQVEAYIKKNRDVRDHACGHLDENSTVEQINNELDALDVDKLMKAYNHMLCFFNYICNNVFCLKVVSLPARVRIHGAQMVTPGNIETFYGEKPVEAELRQMSCTEIMRAIRMKNDDYDEAADALRKKLMSHDESEYQEIIAYVEQRLREPSVGDEETTTIIHALVQAKNGYPERVQRTLLEMFMDSAIFALHGGHLLWMLPSICREDKDVDVPAILGNIIKQKKIIPTSLSVLALLHLTVVKNHSMFVDKNKAHEVSDEVKNYCAAVSNPTEKCALMLMLCQRWLHDTEYSYYRTYESEYTNFFKAELKTALYAYFKYIRLNDQKEKDYCESCLNTMHYLLLLQHLVAIENSRNQKPNVFAEMWRYNCFFRTASDVYEALGVGLLDEAVGNKEQAQTVLESIVRNNPIHDEANRVLADFYQRNPEMKEGKRT